MNEVTPELEDKPEEVVVPSETTTEPEPDELAKAKTIADNQRIRAEKAEAALEAAKRVPSENKPDSMDTIHLAAAIAKGTVHEEDIERVQRYAKLEGLTLKEALKSEELTAILGVRAEQRKSAEVANVSPSRRSPAKISDESLVERASKGDLPDSDEDIARLVAAKAKYKG